MKKIILTGGGTAGHVTPNIALLSGLSDLEYSVEYIGSHTGIEKDLIAECGIPYHGISSGKLRRYLSVKNFTDTFRVAKGLADAISLVKKIRPDIVFSKGGFVSVPVVMAARLCRIPVVIHESDMSCGLANKIALPFADTICVSFPETLKHLPKNKAVLTGTPIREVLFTGNREMGLEICGFDKSKPVVFVMGGSLGSVKLNTTLRKSLPKLLRSYQIVHICGKGNLDEGLKQTKGYAQFEYVSSQLSHLFAAACLVVSRAGANSISEFLALRKPSLLIPLSRNASRGDQILNAESFERQCFSKILYEEDLRDDRLVTAIIDLYANRDKMVEVMNKSSLNNGTEAVLQQITKISKRDATK